MTGDVSAGGLQQSKTWSCNGSCHPLSATKQMETLLCLCLTPFLCSRFGDFPCSCEVDCADEKENRLQPASVRWLVLLAQSESSQAAFWGSLSARRLLPCFHCSQERWGPKRRGKLLHLLLLHLLLLHSSLCRQYSPEGIALASSLLQPNTGTSNDISCNPGQTRLSLFPLFAFLPLTLSTQICAHKEKGNFLLCVFSYAVCGLTKSGKKMSFGSIQIAWLGQTSWLGVI